MTEGSTKSGTVRRFARRGKARFVGVGLGFVAAALPAVASAGGQFQHTSQLWFVNVNGQNFNVIEPICLWFLNRG
jgi:hypothetical protein